MPYPAASCISIDDEVVHGIPSGRIVRKGEIVSIDIGVKLNGWCADSAVTWPVGEISKEKQKLIQVTEDTLRSAIGHLNINTTWRQIARMMQAKVAKEGFSVVEDLVGHAIGEQMWEAPQIPNYFTTRMPDFRILPGLVFAIEPMINMGTKKVVICDDYWTIVTDDGLPSAHFEHTVAITEDGPIVLTCGPNGEGWAM